MDPVGGSQDGESWCPNLVPLVGPRGRGSHTTGKFPYRL